MTPRPPELAASPRRTLRAFIEAVLPPTPVPSEGLVDALIGEVELSMSYLPSYTRLPLRLGFFALEHASLCMGPRARRFYKLSGDDRARYLERWASSPLSLQRNFFKALKAFTVIAYYERPEIMAHLDYDPQSYVDELKVRNGNRSA